MKNKLVIFDIDGTILDHDKKIPKMTKVAIKELQDKGVNVAIATGRAPFMFKELREELNIHNYVCFNGQLVIYNDEVVDEFPISMELREGIVKEATEFGFPIVFLDQKEMKTTVEGSKHIKEAMDSLFMNYPALDENFYKTTTTYQALLFCEDEQEYDFTSKFTDQLHFIRWHKYSVDVLPAGGSKARGIQKLMDKLHISVENVYAFGDGLNDIEMIQFVGNGIVMGNGEEELKKIASFVTKDVAEDGIYHGLKWTGLL